MAYTYSDVVASMFGSRRFTTREFARRASNPRAAKILSDLKRRGVVERVGRGSYRCLGPGEKPDLRAMEWNRVRDVVLSGPDPKAWAGDTAVERWTGGRYRLAPSMYSQTFKLAVPAGSEGVWEDYLRRYGVSTRSGKLIGARVELLPRGKVEAVSLDDEPVLPREEVVRLIRDHPALFANAEELLLD